MLERLEKSTIMDAMKTSAAIVRPSLGYRPFGNKARNRENEQERLQAIAWITAMLECEGTFTFQYNEQYKNGRMHSHIQPRVIFVNSDRLLVDTVDVTLARLTGIKPYRKDGIRCGMGKKLKSEIQINGFKVLPFLKQIRPYIAGSKAQIVDYMIQFIEYRQSLALPKQAYGDFEFDLLAKVRKINSGHWKKQPKFAAISSTTVRRRRALAKKQSGLHGDVQSVAEMTTPTDKIQ